MTDQAVSAAHRILVVEDEMLVAMLIEDMLIELGYDIVAMASKLEDAFDYVENKQFDAAILDVNLNGKRTYPLADILSERNIPFIFATGYGASGLDDRFKDIPTLQKPFTKDDLERVLSKIF